MTSPFPPPSPPGWYPDPWRPGAIRFYDGRSWTVHMALPTLGRPWAVTPARPPHPHVPLPIAVGALVVLGVSLVLSRIVLGSLVDATKWPVVSYVALAAVLGYGPSLVWGCLAVRRWMPGTAMFGAIGQRVRWRDVGWGAVIWLSAVGAEIVVVLVLTLTRIPITPNTEGIRELDADRTFIVAQLIVAVVCAPLVEEYVFRGLVLRGFLGRMHPVTAVGLQGVLFGAAHIGPERGVGNIGLVLVLSSVGIVFGGGVYLLRRVPPSIVAHAIFNAVVMIIVLTR